MIKKSRDNKFIISFENETSVKIEAVKGFSPTVFDFALCVSECFRVDPNERLDSDILNITLIVDDEERKIEIERQHCMLLYLEKLAKQLPL